MPSYTRGDREANSLVRTFDTGDDLVSTPSRRKGLTRAGHRKEPFTGQEYNNAIVSSVIPGEWDVNEAMSLRELAREVDFLRKRISTFTDDRGRTRSEYFTDEMGRLKIPYGSMQENSGSPTNIAMATSGTFYGWVSAADDITYGAPYVTFAGDATADQLVIGADGAGVWICNAYASVETDSSTFLLTMAIHVNGSQDLSLSSAIDFDANDEREFLAVAGPIELDPGDYVDLRFKADANTKDVDVSHAHVTLHRISHKR